jgi:AbrB family looped-hinge helix DNA binding protein
MRTYKVDSRGRITLPKHIREHLGVGPGDRIEFELMRDGQGVLIWAKPSKYEPGEATDITIATCASCKYKFIVNSSDAEEDTSTISHPEPIRRGAMRRIRALYARLGKASV